MEGICFPVTGATFALIPQVAAGSPLGKYNHHLRLNVPFALIFRGGDLLGWPLQSPFLGGSRFKKQTTFTLR